VETDQVFQGFKTVFTAAPILVHSNFSKPFFLESDSFDYALGGLEQFYLRKEGTNDFTLLHFIQENSQLQRLIMKFMIKNF
jgi:hypothetical protein